MRHRQRIALDYLSEMVVGPLTIMRDARLDGIVAGDAIVVSGVHLELRGVVDGDLTIEQGASVCVQGVVTGSVINRGICDVSGIVVQQITADGEAATPRRHRFDGGRSHLRASDAEREAVAARLRGHAVAGRLDFAVFEERLGRALGARTRAELAALEHDLPPLGRERHFVNVMRGPPVRLSPRLRRIARATLPSGSTALLGLAVTASVAWVAFGEHPLDDYLREHPCQTAAPFMYGVQVVDRADGWQEINGKQIFCRDGQNQRPVVA